MGGEQGGKTIAQTLKRVYLYTAATFALKGDHYPYVALATALVATLVFVFVFLERRRGSPAGRAAPLIRQIQEDAVQGMLLIIASIVVFSAITSVMHWALIKGNAVEPPTGIYIPEFGVAENGPCDLPSQLPKFSTKTPAFHFSSGGDGTHSRRPAHAGGRGGAGRC